MEPDDPGSAPFEDDFFDDGQKDLDDMTDEELLEELNKSKPENDPAHLDVPSFREQGGEDADVELKTVDALEDSLKDLSSMDGRENSYVEIPKLDLKHIIISNEKIHDVLENLLPPNQNTGMNQIMYFFRIYLKNLIVNS